MKTNQLQRIIRTGRTGHWLNHSKEHCLVGIKGNPLVNRNIDTDVIVAEVRETSRKPDEVHSLLWFMVLYSPQKHCVFSYKKILTIVYNVFLPYCNNKHAHFKAILLHSLNLFCCADVPHARKNKPKDKEAGTVCKNA